MYKTCRKSILFRDFDVKIGMQCERIDFLLLAGLLVAICF